MSVYVIAQIELKYGKTAQFNDAMTKLVPLMEQRGWTLVAAYQNLIGDLHGVTDVWQLSEANAVGEALASLAGDASFTSLLPELAESVDRETIRLATKTSFSPV
jgi:hypothetical protein